MASMSWSEPGYDEIPTCDHVHTCRTCRAEFDCPGEEYRWGDGTVCVLYHDDGQQWCGGDRCLNDEPEQMAQDRRL